MPFGFDTKQQVGSYIAQERHRQSRYAIDSYVLEAGCSSALVDQVWRELARPKRYSRLIVAWSFLNLNITLWILWTGFGLGFIVGWSSIEWALVGSRSAPLIVWIIWLTPLLWQATFLKIVSKPLLPKWTRLLSRVVIAGFVAWFLFILWDSSYGDTFCAAPHTYALDRVVTSQSRYILIDSFVSPFGDDLYSNSSYYRAELYQCNTFGLGCHVIVQEDFPQVRWRAFCAVPELHLQPGTTEPIVIVQESDRKGLTSD